MNGPVLQAASPARPGRRPDVPGRVGQVLVAPVRALGFFGLALAGAVLLVVTIAPVAFGAFGLIQIIDDVSKRQFALSNDAGQPGQALPLVLIGLACCLFILPRALLAARWVANQTRLLSAHWCGVAIPAAYQPSPLERRPDRRLGTARLRYRQRMEWLLGDPGTWRDLCWLAVSAVVSTVMLLAPIALVVFGALVAANVSRHLVGAADLSGPERVGGALLLAVGATAAPWTLRAYGNLARLVLAPSEHSVLERRVAYLAQTRQESLEGGAAELRRIERDLHDGAQARLVAMGLTLDAAGRLIDTDPAAARSLLIEARDASAKALAELRDLVRGVHPPVLADRGLAEAVRALALDSPARARVTGSLERRAPAPVESAAYFAVSELLANVAKHAGAQSAEVDLRHSLGALRISVRDDGAGGADAARGTGLRGVERRIAAFDGVLAISSPAGGPTVITMEIPCALS
ncbi:MAG TPA: histidine kinase [Trebonia sp.]|nr:histidine kinase [Trebonia sp.]